MQKKLSLILLEKQSGLTVPQPDLSANDFADVLEGSASVDVDVEQDNRGGGGFQNNPATVGKSTADISLTYSLYSRGSAASEPSFIRALECAGWERQLDNPNIIMRPRNDIVDAATIYAYSGGVGADKSLLEKFKNVMFDGVVNLEAGKRATLELSGKGAYYAPPVVATQPNVDGYRERVTAPPLMGATVSINGKAYKFLTCTLNFGQTVEPDVDATDTYGGGESEIVERNINWTATVYMKPDSDFVPHTNLFAGTTGTLDFQWGTKFGTPDCRILAPKATIHNVKEADNNGVLTWELTGIIEDNDVELRIYNGNASSYSSISRSDSSDSNSSSATV